MTEALLLVDLQHDFLASPGLEPPPGSVVAGAAALLEGWRTRGAPVVHVWTTVSRSDDRRMPHWREAGAWRCEEGTPGHATPPPLQPRDGEPVVHKTDYDAFDGTPLEETLRALDADAVVLAGTHLHACIRSTALGAYRRRFGVVLAEDAISSDDPLHAAAARAWLEPRGIAFRSVGELLAPESQEHAGWIVHERPARTGTVAWRIEAGGPRDVERAAAAAAAAAPDWADAGGEARTAVLARLAELIGQQAEPLVDAVVADVGKPITQAREEVARAIALLHAVCARGDDSASVACEPETVAQDRPLGAIALVTPWNNPLAIPVGKIAPALVYGNTLAWKPAPAGTRVAVELTRLLRAAGAPAGVVSMVAGDARTARLLMEHPAIEAVSLTGGAAAGWAARAICGRRGVPLQAELGGNNPALVAADADLDAAAAAIAEGAFGFAGQRCTANRRAIVERAALDDFLARLIDATSRIAWGRPEDPATVAGPLISTAARRRVEGAIARAVDAGANLLTPPLEAWPGAAALRAEGAYLPPTVLSSDDPTAEIVQEETFGPVLVVQPAQDWTEAIRLANGVRQGLAAAAFTGSADAEARVPAPRPRGRPQARHQHRGRRRRGAVRWLEALRCRATRARRRQPRLLHAPARGVRMTGERWLPAVVGNNHSAVEPDPILVGVLPGEGAAPDLVMAALRVLDAVATAHRLAVEVVHGPPADRSGMSAEVDAFLRDVFARGGAVLAGAIGGRFVYDVRRDLDLFCKLVPVHPWEALLDASPFRPDHLRGVDLVVVRENASGLYQGHGRREADRAEHTFGYSLEEVERIVAVAARLADSRRRRLTVVVKDGGLPELSGLWRDGAEAACSPLKIVPSFVDVDLCAYQLLRDPAALDVVVAPNLFGDILADLSALLLGGRGVSYSGNFAASGAAIYQTNHGAAFDLAGAGAANPVGQICALAMLLRESAGRPAAADAILAAVDRVWQGGWRTRDVACPEHRVVGTVEFTDLVVEAIGG